MIIIIACDTDYTLIYHPYVNMLLINCCCWNYLICSNFSANPIQQLFIIFPVGDFDVHCYVFNRLDYRAVNSRLIPQLIKLFIIMNYSSKLATFLKWFSFLIAVNIIIIIKWGNFCRCFCRQWPIFAQEKQHDLNKYEVKRASAV